LNSPWTNTWIIWSALEQNGGSPIYKGPIDDIRVTGNPANVCHTAKNVVGVVVVEHVLVGEGCILEVKKEVDKNGTKCFLGSTWHYGYFFRLGALNDAQQLCGSVG
jgi:hypothetical protein